MGRKRWAVGSGGRVDGIGELVGGMMGGRAVGGEERVGERGWQEPRGKQRSSADMPERSPETLQKQHTPNCVRLYSNKLMQTPTSHSGAPTILEYD